MRFLILTMLLATSAYAQESNKVSINTVNKATLHIANSNNLAEAETKNNDLAPLTDVYKVCSDKGLIYLGAGASNVDADNCYDVTNTTNPDSQFRQVLAGRISSLKSFTSGAANYDSNFVGRFAADKQCNSTFAGSRALVFADLPYVYNQFSSMGITGTYWVYDTAQSYHDYVSSSSSYFTNKSLVSSSSSVGVANVNDCNGWSASSAYSGTIATAAAGGVVTLSTQQCNSSAYIACVYN